LGDHGGIVNIRQRRGDYTGVVVHPVVKSLTAGDKTRDSLVFVQSLAAAGELAVLVHGKVGVGAKLRVHAKILEIGLGYLLAQGVGQAADAQLYGGAVRYLGQNV